MNRNQKDELRIELVEEQDLVEDKVWYHIKIDGKHVENTYHRDLEIVRAKYENILKNHGQLKKEVILKSEVFTYEPSPSQAL